MAFYDRLKEGRIKVGLTQEQLAEKLGVAKSTLSGYESGNREPTVATIAKALEILDIDANFLYQDETDALGGSPTQLKYEEMEHIKKYRTLDAHGKEMVDFTLGKEYERCAELKTQRPDINKQRYAVSELNAAHERTDIKITNEMKQYDDDIMDDDDF